MPDPSGARRFIRRASPCCTWSRPAWRGRPGLCIGSAAAPPSRCSPIRAMRYSSMTMSVSTMFSRISCKKRLLLDLAASLALLLPLTGGAADPDDVARAIAGVSSKEISSHWNAYENRIGRAMRRWACEELPPADGATVFYPFAGPDLPTAVQLFPDAERYVLVSLQKAGRPPGLEEGQIAAGALEGYLAEFQKNWRFYGTLGFFRTEDLEPFGMTGPLMALAARLGYRVEFVEPIGLDAAGGDMVTLADSPGSRWDSVRLTLRKGGRTSIVDYVHMDLSDGWLGQATQQTDRERAWIKSMAANPTLLKAASHLPQEPGFSILRTALLENAPLIVQDESGIDYGALSGAFTVRLYGRFTRVNSSFPAHLQSSLAAAYRSNGGAKPLPFAVGYEKSAGSALQVALREGGSAGPAARPGARCRP